MVFYSPALLAWAVLPHLAHVLAACDTEIAAILPGKVFAANTTTYSESVSSYFYTGNRQNPAYIVAPSTAEEVAAVFKVISVCNPDYVAVRSGGHSPNKGFSNTDHGFTIDLRGLDTITLPKEVPGVVRVGTGALWSDVYNALDPLNLTVVGARVASVGVGGFLTGGGISFFSPKYGFGSDSVRNMQVVLANGTIVDANAASNPRLFRALKGGQNNFGVVTRFDLNTHPQAPFWGGAVSYPAAADAAQIAAFADLKAGAYDPYVAIEQTHVYVLANDNYLSTNNMFYTKPGVANASALRPFAEIQPQLTNTMRMSQAADFAEELEAFQQPGQFAIYATLSFPVSKSALVKVHSMWREAVPRLAARVSDLTAAMTFQSIPPPPPAGAPPNSMPFSATDTPQKDMLLLLFSFFSVNGQDGIAIDAAVKQLTRRVENEQPAAKAAYKYLNYAAPWQNPIASYGKERDRELKEVSRMYDPTGLFQKVVNGGFKL